MTQTLSGKPQRRVKGGSFDRFFSSMTGGCGGGGSSADCNDNKKACSSLLSIVFVEILTGCQPTQTLACACNSSKLQVRERACNSTLQNFAISLRCAYELGCSYLNTGCSNR